MLDRLVAMRIITHIHNGHLTDFVDGESVIAVIEYWRDRKYGIQHRDKHVLTSHQIHQSLGVVEDRPCIMPTVTLSKVTAPLQRRKVFFKLSILLLTAHQIVIGTEEALVVHGSPLELLDFLFRTIQFLGQLQDTPIIIGILQRTGCTFMNTHIARHIAQLVIVFVSQAPCRRDLRMNILCTIDQTGIKSFQILHTDTLHIGIHQNRSRVVAHHTSPMSRTCPLGEKSAFLVCIDKPFLNHLVYRRIHQV